MSCDTNLGRLRKAVLAALSRYREATDAVRACPIDSPELETKCSERELACAQLMRLINRQVPGKLRDALRSGANEIGALPEVKFKSRDPESYSLWVWPT